MIAIGKIIGITAVILVLIAPAAFLIMDGIPFAAAQSSPSGVVGTTLAFDNGNVVTLQYSNQLWFCNTAGGNCAVGASGPAPVAEQATNQFLVIVPAFLQPVCTILTNNGVTEQCLSSAGFVKPISNPTVLTGALGFNNFAQCPDIVDPAVPIEGATCPNHPTTIDMSSSLPFGLGIGVIPLPIHSHILSGNGVAGGQGGWWETSVYLVLDPSVWPNPSTGACAPGVSNCLTSAMALNNAVASGQAVGPVPTNLYLFFSVVGSSGK
jgi:hypothetical protein